MQPWWAFIPKNKQLNKTTKNPYLPKLLYNSAQYTQFSYFDIVQCFVTICIVKNK